MKHHTSATTEVAGQRRKGFTLIELLVVIAIIAILAAILFPVFARARENARRTACLSNMKQIGLGLMQYTQDYDERYPFQPYAEVANYSTSNNTSDANTNWIVAISPYLKSTQIFICPSAGPFNATGNSDTNYVGNGVILQRSGPTSLALAAINETASTIMMQEYAYRTLYSLDRPFLTNQSPVEYGYWLTDNAYSSLHFDGGNLLFADGHAKWRKTNSICAKEFGIDNASCGDMLGSTANSVTGPPLF